MTRFERFGAFLGRHLTARPKTALALCVALFVLGACGLLKARFSTDYRIFFSKEDPGLASFQRLEQVFTKTDNVLFVVGVNDGDVFTADALSALQELTEAGWKLPYAARADSLVNFPFAESDGDDVRVHPLLEALTPEGIAAAKARARAEPILVGSLLAKDNRTAAVNVTLRLPRQDPEEVPRATQAARALVAQVKQRHPGLDVRATGMVFVNDAFMETSIQDMAVMLPLMLLVMLVSMALMLRSALATAAVASVIAVSAALSVAAAGWLGYPLSPTSVAAPMIVLTVAIADGVHIVLATLEQMREGLSKPRAIVAALSGNLEAVTYTWLTTVVGFLCLNYSDAPPVLHLSNMSSFGVTVAFIFSVTLLPALLCVLPIRVPKARPQSSGRFFGRLGTFVMRHRGPVLAGAAIVTLGGGLLASRLETNDEFIQYFDASLPFRQDVDFAMERLSGVYRLEFQLGAGRAQGVTDPKYLGHLDAFGRWLSEQPEVQHVYGLHQLLGRVVQVMNGGERRLPRTKAEASEAYLLYTLDLPAGLDLTDRVNVDQSASRLTVTVRDMSTRKMTAFAERAEGWLRTHAPESMWAQATGPVVIFSALSERNARGMVQGDLWSLLLISICMVMVLRSLKLGLISVIPNLVPIVVGYGIWWLCVGELNVVGTIAGSISLGIIVDDTIHFLTKYRALLNQPNATPELAMRHTLEHVGPAMISTSIVLVMGFGVLTLSHFRMTSHLGWLSVLIVGIAPFADLVIAPALVLGLPRLKTTSFGLVAGKVGAS
jgi:predicted RND superfamily exporter protein